MQDELDERGTDDESSESSDQEEKWDAETILSTYTNTDNHPSVIKFTRVVKTKATIQLHKQFKVPVDGLNGLIPIAEEVEVKREKKQAAKNAYEEDSD